MKILITGGLGYLGSWITDHLVRRGHEVTTFSQSDRDILRGTDFVRTFGDITDLNGLKATIGGHQWDAVIHLASGGNDARSYLSVNTLGTRNLVELLSHDSPAAHFIYFSTFHVYGRSSGLISESTSTLPRSDYAATHLFAEYTIRQVDLPFTIFRLTNGYGCPLEITTSKWDLAVNDMARMAYRDKEIKLRSNGKGRRDFVWLGDVCDAVEKILAIGPTGELFNLSSGHSIGTLELAHRIADAYRATFDTEIPIHINDSDPTPDLGDLVVSPERLKKWIHFEPADQIQEEAIKIFELLA